MSAYYNEIDPDAALILRELIADGVIAAGEIDTRSIIEVQPDDLRGFTQCHFFAGGGLWSVAARMAGWADDRPLWTASCPCQPFSVAGKGAGTDDARHLWPDLLRLASACRPAVVVGEQVAGKAGYGWLDGVRADLAGEGYASRGVDIPACAVDAPHIRQRLYWVALADAQSIDRRGNVAIWQAEGRAVDGRVDAGGASGVTQGDAIRSRLEGQRGHGNGSTGRTIEDRPVAPADGGDVGDADRGGAGAQSGNDGEVRGLPEAQRKPELGPALPWRADGGCMEHADVAVGRVGDQQSAGQQPEHEQQPGIYVRAGSRNGSYWSDHEWLACHDGKARRTQPGIPLLVDGLPGRVGLWRVAGNAISPVLAAEVIGALKDELDAHTQRRAA